MMIACDERDIEKERERNVSVCIEVQTQTQVNSHQSLLPHVASPFVGSLNVIKLFHRTLNYEIKKEKLRHDMRRSQKLLQKDSRE